MHCALISAALPPRRRSLATCRIGQPCPYCVTSAALSAGILFSNVPGFRPEEVQKQGTALAAVALTTVTLLAVPQMRAADRAQAIDIPFKEPEASAPARTLSTYSSCAAFSALSAFSGTRAAALCPSSSRARWQMSRRPAPPAVLLHHTSQSPQQRDRPRLRRDLFRQSLKSPPPLGGCSCAQIIELADDRAKALALHLEKVGAKMYGAFWCRRAMRCDQGTPGGVRARAVRGTLRRSGCWWCVRP